MLPRVLPFACYMGFVWIAAFLSTDAVGLSKELLLWLYPLKITFVTVLLAFYSQHYTELKKKPLAKRQDLLLAVSVGGLVYLSPGFRWTFPGLGRAKYAWVTRLFWLALF